MIDMAKSRGRPKRTKPPVPIQIKVDEDMAAALETLAGRNRRSRTLELTLILEEKLRAEGLWPPKPDAEAPDADEGGD